MKAYPALLICLSGICSVTVRRATARRHSDRCTPGAGFQLRDDRCGIRSDYPIECGQPRAHRRRGLRPAKYGCNSWTRRGNCLKKWAIDNLAAGRAASLDLAHTEPAAGACYFDAAADSNAGRCAEQHPSGPIPLGPEIPVRLGCTVIPTVEIFDNDTGKTTIGRSSAQTVAVSETAVSPLAASIRP